MVGWVARLVAVSCLQKQFSVFSGNAWHSSWRRATRLAVILVTFGGAINRNASRLTARLVALNNGMGGNIAI